METEHTTVEKMQTLNVKPATKKAFRELKWKLQQELNQPKMTDDEMVLFISTNLHKADDEKRYGNLFFRINDNGGE